MTEYNSETIQEAQIVSKAFRIPSGNRFSICALVRMSKRHARLSEIKSRKKLSSAQTEELENLEGDIRAIVMEFGLSVTFEYRTNGWTVRLHDRNRSVNNVLGGSDNGYGVGRPQTL